MSKDLELFKFTRRYLGKENWEFVKKTTKAELALFQKVDIDLSKSYFLLGNQEILSKFKAFYLTRCLKKRPLYTSCSMYEYARELSSGVKDEYGLNVDQDLLFLYLHKHMWSLGNSETWLMETTLNKVADRNRDGLTTIILSETRAPLLENSGELVVVNLSGVINSKTKEEICKGIVNGQGNISKDFNVFD